MILYQSSLNHTILKKYFMKTKRILSGLVSFALLESDTSEMIKEKGNALGGLILDCGAWTDQKSANPTDINAYIDYLLIAGKHFDFYFNLDQDFNENYFSSLNYKHLLKLENAGLKPVPVIHSLHDDEIEYYLERQYPIVALGSSYATELDALKVVFDKFSKYPETKIHIFGTTSFDNLTKVPVYSVDSSSWGTSGKYGHMVYWNPESEKFDKTETIYIGGYYHPNRVHEHHYVTYYCRKQLDEYLYNTFQFTYADFFGDSGYYNLQIVNLYHYAEIEKRITEEHRKKGFIS